MMKIMEKAACTAAISLALVGVAHAQSNELEQPFWTKQILGVTGGHVTANFKPWNEMGLKGPEVFKMLGRGLFDVGTSQLGFVAGENVTQKTLQEQYAKLEEAIYYQNVRENDLGLACNTGGACSKGPAANMTLVQPTVADVELRKKALIEQVLPRWAVRCGAVCVKIWNDTIGKTVDLHAAAK